jgi:hypothetical protein
MGGVVPELILGPMLRYVGERSATVWVETSDRCVVDVLGCAARSFSVLGHHYALVVVEGLTPGTTTPYDVRLDGAVVWPLPESALPPPVIRTRTPDQPVRVLFGSCRAAAPHEEPWTLELELDERGRGIDAMRQRGLAMIEQPPDEWPDLLLLLGDQVYADDSSPVTRARIAERRRHLDGNDLTPEHDEVADFEEYTWLYHESWTPEIERWMFSVVPSMMIFDDHDMIDDWNISQAWVDDIRQHAWWEEHVVGGVMAYWVYQHLGNLGPDEIEADGMLRDFVLAGDASELLREWALRSERFTPVPGGYRFSVCRDVGRVRIVVVDCRNGRVLTPGNRRMVDDAEWAWVSEHAMAPCDHLLIATSLPFLMPGALHDLEAWSEAVCDGAWGDRFSRVGERIRRAIDLEDWPAFRVSFERLVALLRDVATPDRGDGSPPPATVCVLSGDVHFTYGVAATFDPPDGRPPVHSAVHQLVCSPIRNALVHRERAAIRFAMSRLGRITGAVLRRSVGNQLPSIRWDRSPRIMFNNDMAMLVLDGRDAAVDLHNSGDEDDRHIVLSRV